LKDTRLPRLFADAPSVSELTAAVRQPPRAGAEGAGAIRQWVDGYVLTKFLHDSLVK
jgi:hypothetical protein